jgi:hypothetical protein
MAESNITSANSFSIPNISHLTGAKLEGPNYIVWVSRFLPILRTNGLMNIVDGSEPAPPKYLPKPASMSTAPLNPEFVLWEKKDQFILSWLIASLSEKVVATVYGLNTSHEVWTALAHCYASPSKSRINNLRRQLQNLRQGTQTCSDFFLGAKSIADQLALVGQPVGDEDLLSYIVGGLSPQYNPFIASLWAGKDRSLRVDDFQSELLNYEQLLEHQMASVDTGSFARCSRKPNGAKGKPKLNNGKPRTGQI